jgi:hypothetical protein
MNRWTKSADLATPGRCGWADAESERYPDGEAGEKTTIATTGLKNMQSNTTLRDLCTHQEQQAGRSQFNSL